MTIKDGSESTLSTAQPWFQSVFKILFIFRLLMSEYSQHHQRTEFLNPEVTFQGASYTNYSIIYLSLEAQRNPCSFSQGSPISEHLHPHRLCKHAFFSSTCQSKQRFISKSWSWQTLRLFLLLIVLVTNCLKTDILLSGSRSASYSF